MRVEDITADRDYDIGSIGITKIDGKSQVYIIHISFLSLSLSLSLVS